MKPRALLLLAFLAVPLTASADFQVQCESPPPPPQPSRFDCLFPKGVTLRGREANWTRGYIGRLVIRGLRSYSTTGHVPNTGVWRYLRRQHDLRPAAFNATHPYFQGLFDEPDVIGQLPDGKFWRKLENQYDNRRVQFNRCYPYLDEFLKRDKLADRVTGGSPGVPNPPGGQTPPNPGTPPGGTPTEPFNPNNPGFPNPPSGGGPPVVPVPEPASILLVASGLGALALVSRRARRRFAQV